MPEIYPLVKTWGNKFGYRGLPKMMDDIAIAAKPFIVLSTNRDLPNPMSLHECVAERPEEAQ
jgi:hypothetical protein